MATTYRILVPINLVYVQLSGTINLQEISEALQSYVVDSDFNPNQKQLIDLRSMRDAFTVMWEMGQYKKLYEKLYEDLPKPIPVAIVTSSPFGKRLAWMYSRVMKDRQTLNLEVFHDIESALLHFGLQEEIFVEHLHRSGNADVIHLNRYRTTKELAR